MRIDSKMASSLEQGKGWGAGCRGNLAGCGGPRPRPSLSTTACVLPPQTRPRGPAGHSVLGRVHSGSLGNINTNLWGGKPSKPATPEGSGG